MIKAAEYSFEQAGLPLLHAGDRGSAAEVRSSQAQWHALYTRSRHEKIVVRELAKHKIETFLPLRKIKRHWSDRVKLIEEPIFGGYVFTRISLSQKFTVLNTYGAVSFVHFGSNLPAVIPDRDIEALVKFSESDLPMDPFPYLTAGQRVYIRSGLMKGVEGFIVRKNNQCRLVISVDVLQQSISVEVDQASVELC